MHQQPGPLPKMSCMMTFISTDISRRGAMGLIAGAFAFAATPGMAISPNQAKSMVDSLVKDINAIIASGQSEAAMIRQFEAIFLKYGDVPAIARSALGPQARSLSSSDLNAYVKAFSGYMSRKYGKRFREFIGGRIEVQGGRSKGKFYEVSTRAFLRGEAPFDLTFVISDRGGQNRFINMLFEGVNVLASEREEVGARLNRAGGSISGLIADLNRAG